MAKNKIKIKPSKRGTFTAAAKKRGKGVQEFASQVLSNKDAYSPAMVKKANFARNASKFKKEYGGYHLPQYGLGGDIFGGATSGLAAGSAFGPVGAGVGAVVGGIAGVIGGKKKREAARQQRRMQERANDRALAFAQYDPSGQQEYAQVFKRGGTYRVPGKPYESVTTPIYKPITARTAYLEGKKSGLLPKDLKYKDFSKDTETYSRLLSAAGDYQYDPKAKTGTESGFTKRFVDVQEGVTGDPILTTKAKFGKGGMKRSYQEGGDVPPQVNMQDLTYYINQEDRLNDLYADRLTDQLDMFPPVPAQGRVQDYTPFIQQEDRLNMAQADLLTTQLDSQEANIPKVRAQDLSYFIDQENRLNDLRAMQDEPPLEFRYGGMSPESMMGGVPNAELEGGESLITPDGTNVDLEGPSHEQGGIDMNLEPGTRIFSDDVKDPDNGKTFSELNKKMTNSMQKYQDILDDPEATKIAKRTAERMLKNLEGKQDELFMKQERIKLRKDPINKIKKGKKYQQGGEVTYEDVLGLIDQNFDKLGQSLSGVRQGFNPGDTQAQLAEKRANVISRLDELKDDPKRLEGLYNQIVSQGLATPTTTATTATQEQGSSAFATPMSRAIAGAVSPYAERQRLRLSPEISSAFLPQELKDIPSSGVETGNNIVAELDRMQLLESRGIGDSLNSTAPDARTLAAYTPAPIRPGYGTDINAQPLQGLGLGAGQTAPSATALQASGVGFQPEGATQEQLVTATQGQAPQAGGFNIGNIATGLAQAAPALYNLGQGLFGETETLDPSLYQNTAGQAAAARLRNRRYNIDPQLAATRRAFATGRRDVTSAARTRGELLSNLGGLSAQQASAEAGLYAQKQNIENQYLSEAAQLTAQTGAQDAATRMRVADYNARARAAQQGLISTGISQMSQAVQAGQRRRGQEKADQQRPALLRDLYPNFMYNQASGGFDVRQRTV